MRTRRWLTWLVFGVCALAVIEGLGWVTWQAVRSERRELQARAEAEFGESIRLALWRMESQATPILAQEAARPYFQYHSFYPAERAYNRMWQEVEQNEVLVPSPLLESSGQCIRLHYQVEPDGTITSPQAPTGNMLDLAESQYVDGEFIVLAAQMLTELNGMLRRPDLADRDTFGADALKKEVQLSAPGKAIDQSAAENPTRQINEPLNNKDLEATEKESEARQQAYKIASAPTESQRRGRSERAATGAPQTESGAAKPVAPVPPAAPGAAPASTAAPAADAQTRLVPQIKAYQFAGRAPIEVEQGTFDPLWRVNPRTGSEELLFQRTVRVQGNPRVQGFWMDWPALRTRLLAAASDLLPGAQLRPTVQSQDRSPLSAFRLASLPVELVPGDPPSFAASLVNPAHTTLVVTWLAVLGAIVAIAVVLRTSMELGDRRGRFVSAVTHELRTPLTTFCLYTEMLADGMVPDERARAEYLGTLKGESRRLAGIVENVLEYARLGGRRRPNGHSTCTLDELLAAVTPVLERAAVSGRMQLQVLTEARGSTRLAADVRTIERILLNLAENACKYASEATDRRLHVEFRPSDDGRTLGISIRDHGPGIPRGESRRVFDAFHRAHRDEDGPKSGLGLGLALARGLARGLAGDLVLVRHDGYGACFLLSIPVATA